MKWKTPLLSYWASTARALASRRVSGSLRTSLLLAGLPLLFLWRLWPLGAADRLFLREGDFSSQYYPLRAYAAREIARGELPLWNPYVFGGQPGLADIQMGALYPPQSLFSLVAGGDLTLGGLQWQVPLHLALAALGSFVLARRVTRSRAGGLVAALVFGLGSYLTSFPVQQLTILSTAAWLPWLLLAIERLSTRAVPSTRDAAALAVVFSLVILAGHPQTAMLVGYCSLAYAAYRLARAGASRIRRAALAGLGLVLGAGLAACQLLPTLEFIGRSTRAGLGFERANVGFGLHEVVGLLYPGFFGGTPQYAGVAALLLATLALVALPLRKTAFWAGLSLTGLILSFGGNTALYPLFYLLLPGWAASRNQERGVVWLAFGAAMLAAHGAAHIGRPDCARLLTAGHRALARLTALAVAFGLLLFAASRLPPPPGMDYNLFGGILMQHVWLLLSLGIAALLTRWRYQERVSGRTLQAGLLALLAANLLSANWRYNLGPAPATAAQASREVTAYLVANLPPGRRLASGGLLPEGNNAGMVYAVPDTTGNTPLALESYSEFERRVPEYRRWQLLSVAYVILPDGAQPGPELEPALAGRPGLYRLRQPQSPVRLVHEVISAVGEGVWQALALADHQPGRQAVVAPGYAFALSPAAGEEAATVTLWSPGDVRADVQASAAGLAVFSLVAYPGWRASLGGRSVTPVTTAGVFLGVPVAAGSHHIRLQYRPLAFQVGLAISALAALFLLALAAAPTRLRTYPEGRT